MSAQLNDVSMNKKGLLFLFTAYSCIGKKACLIKIYLIVYSYAFGRHIAHATRDTNATKNDCTRAL